MPDTQVPLVPSNPIGFKAADNGDGTYSLGVASQAAQQATLLASAANTIDPPIGVIANPNSFVRGLRLFWTFTAIPAAGAAPVMSLWEVEPVTGLLVQKGATTLAAPAAGTAASAAAPVFRRLTLYPANLTGAVVAGLSFEAADLEIVGA